MIVQLALIKIMCMSCWQKYGSPMIRNKKTLAAVPLIAEVYEHSHAGGGLHVLLDDWNLEFVSERYSDADNEESNEAIVAEEKCLKAFQEMTIEERASALGMHNGFFK